MGGHKQGEAVIETQEVALDLIEDREPLYLSERKKSPKEWEKNKNKLLSMQGKMYKGMTKDDIGQYKFNLERMERQLKNPKCTKGCKHYKIFSDNDRKTLTSFGSIWTEIRNKHVLQI